MSDNLDKQIDDLIMRMKDCISHENKHNQQFTDRCITKMQFKRELKSLLIQEKLKGQIEALDEVIGIYNQMFEPNGEFKPFNKLTQKDVANLYMNIGEKIRSLEAQLKTKPEEDEE